MLVLCVGDIICGYVCYAIQLIMNEKFLSVAVVLVHISLMWQSVG